MSVHLLFEVLRLVLDFLFFLTGLVEHFFERFVTGYQIGRFLVQHVELHLEFVVFVLDLSEGVAGLVYLLIIDSHSIIQLLNLIGFASNVLLKDGLLLF